MTLIRLAYGGPDRALAKGLGEMTDIRLGMATDHGGNIGRLKRSLPVPEDEMTDVRLVGANQDGTDGGQRYQRTAFAEPEDDMTEVRLVGQSHGNERVPRALSAFDGRPALLVSYAYWKQFAKFRHEYHFRDYALDSGAFTVHNSGGTIDLQEYIDFCKERMANDDQLAEIFALDVIDHPEASATNTEAMWTAGVPAVPCYHSGEPEEFLIEMAKRYPKIALGGAVGMPTKAKRKWVDQCFARVWPKRIHGFGIMAKEILHNVPFDSVDASNWEMGPAAYGNWRSLGNVKGLRGGKINLRIEVEHYLKLERELKQRWQKQLEKLPHMPPLHQQREEHARV